MRLLPRGAAIIWYKAVSHPIVSFAQFEDCTDKLSSGVLKKVGYDVIVELSEGYLLRSDLKHCLSRISSEEEESIARVWQIFEQLNPEEDLIDFKFCLALLHVNKINESKESDNGELLLFVLECLEEYGLGEQRFYNAVVSKCVQM